MFNSEMEKLRLEIERLIDQKIELLKKDIELSYFGTVAEIKMSGSNPMLDENGKTAYVKVNIVVGETDWIMNKSNQILVVGDTVKVTAFGGNLSNSYVSIKCGNNDPWVQL